MRSPHPFTPVSRHGPNPVGGRDLVIGDVHGEFATLEHALESLQFRPAEDRLFTLGGLIDRGPRSADALDWLEAGRFAGGVRGNHEQMMVHVLLTSTPFEMFRAGLGAAWRLNGGDWWYESEEAHRSRSGLDGGSTSPLPARWLNALATLPYVTTIDYPGRRVGLVHSPGFVDQWLGWDRLIEWTGNVCAAPETDARGAEALERDLLRREPAHLSEDPNDPALLGAVGPDIRDIDLVLTGHCPGLWPRWSRRNVLCIDTGCHFDEYGHLTIAEVHDALVLHRFERTERFQ